MLSIAARNYKPVCSNPRSASMPNVAGYTICANCPPHPVLGPVWHPTKDMPAETLVETVKRVEEEVR